MKYISTRNAHLQFSASQVILQGLSEDQGLFIPDKLVHLELEKCLNDDYQTLAARILAPFLNDFNEEQIQKILHHAYDSFSLLWNRSRTHHAVPDDLAV